MKEPFDEDRYRPDAEKLTDIITVLRRCFIINLSKELNQGDISFPQYFLLGYLTQQSSLSMTEIARKMEHTTAAATGIIDRLERLGYVQRTHAKDDRRKILVKITRRGCTLVTKVHEDMIGGVLNVMSHLTENERKMWLCIYEKIIKIIQDKSCAQ